MNMTWCLFILFCIILQLYDSRSNASQNLAVVPFIATRGKENVKKNLREWITPTTTEEPVKKTCMCSKIYDPVCGSNNQSYYNVCQMECENKAGTVFVLHQGNCIPF